MQGIYIRKDILKYKLHLGMISLVCVFSISNIQSTRSC